MGNYCHSEETPKSDLQTFKKQSKGKLAYQNLILTNRQFLKSCQDSYFILFHKNIVEKDLHSLSKFMNQKMLNTSIKGSYPTEEEIHVISKNISNDIRQKEKHLYNQLIFHYTQFLIELFEQDPKQELQAVPTQNIGDLTIDIQLTRNSWGHKQQQVSEKNISNKSTTDQKILRQFQENKQLAQTFLNQLSCIFKLCYLILEYVYSNYIVAIFGESIESFTDRYLLISKIYQQKIIETNPYIQKLINFAIQIKYENQLSLIQADHISPAALKPQLIPQNNDSVLSNDSDMDLLDSLEKKLKNQKSEENSQNNKQNQDLYYRQTFSTIDKIINCQMPWLKFSLIGKLDLQIVDIFLSARSQSQISYFIDVIKPEDSKVEVLLYILQKYMSTRKNYNLSLCYYELRWMQEDDNVLHKRVKTFICPYFSRFLSLYEIALKTYQRKQAQLLSN